VTARTQLIIDFITGLGWDVEQESGYPLYAGPEILNAPDQLITITPTSGPGYVTEEAGLDNWGFQARVRGPSDNQFASEEAIQQLDFLLLTAPYPVKVDGQTVQICYRSGATPTALPLDPNDRRFEYVCTYLIVTQTGA
jgi:hypothetical protein